MKKALALLQSQIDWIGENNITNSEQLSLLNEIKQALLEPCDNWIVTSERLPEIDESDKWNKEYEITKDILTYSENWGIRFGRYCHKPKTWVIDGVHSFGGTKVDYWQEINPPLK